MCGRSRNMRTRHSNNLGLGNSILPNTVRSTIDRLFLCAGAEPQRPQAVWPSIQPVACCVTSID